MHLIFAKYFSGVQFIIVRHLLVTRISHGYRDRVLEALIKKLTLFSDTMLSQLATLAHSMLFHNSKQLLQLSKHNNEQCTHTDMHN